jgi:hypothetical protein
MKKIISLIVGIMLFNLVLVDASYSLVYQENSDSQTCSGNWYSIGPCVNTYDGSWSTYGMGGTGSVPRGSGTGTVTFSYNVPSTAINSGSLWQVGDGTAKTDGALAAYNLTIPSECWDSDGCFGDIRGGLNFRAISTYVIGIPNTDNTIWSCMNVTSCAYVTLRSTGNAAGHGNVYEEAMIWKNGTCWTKTNNVLFIPTGCIFQKSGSYLIG